MQHHEVSAADRTTETADLAYGLETLFATRQRLFFQLPEIAFQIIQDLSSAIRTDSKYLKPMISSVKQDGSWTPLSQVDPCVAATIVSDDVAEAAFHYDAISNDDSRFSVDHGLHSMSRILLAKCFENVQLNDYYLAQFSGTIKSLAEACSSLRQEVKEALGSSDNSERVVGEIISGGLNSKGWLRCFKRQAGKKNVDLIQRNAQSIQTRFHISVGEALAFSRDEYSVSRQINANLSRMMDIHEGVLYSVSKPYLKGGFDRDEILSEARDGLLRACVKFNPRINASFYTFAKRWIVQRVVSHMDAQSSILSVSQETGSNYRKVKKYRAETERSGGVVSARQTALATGCSIRELAAMDQAYRPPEPLDGYSDSDDKPSFAGYLGSETNSPDQDLEASEASQAVDTLFDHLNPREGHILRARYGIGCNTQTLEDLSQTLGITCEGVRQAQIRAEKKLAAVAIRMGFGLESFFNR